MKIASTVILLFLFGYSFSRKLQDPGAHQLVEMQFSTIRQVIASRDHGQKTHLIVKMPEMEGRWEDIFAPGNYQIKSAKFTAYNEKLQGEVDFLKPDKYLRMSTFIMMKRDAMSKSGWSISIEQVGANCIPVPGPDMRRVKRGFYPDDDCEWWGCIDG